MSDFSARYRSDYTAPDFTIRKVDLCFDLSETKTLVTNTMQVHRLNQDANTLVLDGEHLNLVSVSIDDVVIASTEYKVDLTSLSLNCSAQDCVVTIVTEINPLENSALEGLYLSGDAYCTQCEAEGFRRISYYLDRPDVMAEFTTKVIADKKQYPYLLANGNKISSGELANNKHFATWHDPFPKPCYLFALVAGDFDLLSDTYTTMSGRNVNLEIFVDKGNVEKAKHAMASLIKSMKWDEEVYGLEYDLDVYMIVAVDFFNMGAMENKGLNVFNSKYVLADPLTATDLDYYNIEAVIAHEYFHNWTGNRVTCRDWFQLSLKEGLTVFRDQQFSADHNSALVSRIQNVRYLRSMQFAEDAGPMAHAIRPDKVIEMNNFYTLTVYEKGSEVIRMLNTILGKDNFRKGMDLYFERHDGQAVTCDDFVNAMADASNIDLSQFKHWYSQIGTPLVKAQAEFNENTGEFLLTLNQSQPTQPDTNNLLQIPVKIEVIVGEGESLGKNSQKLLNLTQESQTWSLGQYSQRPVISLFSSFSAPVKVEFKQTDNDLEIIVKNAQDGFSRWDAGQTLLTNYITQLLNDPSTKLPNSLLLTMSNILEREGDYAFKAEQLSLPTFEQLSENIDNVNPIALLDATKTLKHFLANGMREQLSAMFTHCHTNEYSNSQADISKRALKNVCLSYLSVLDGGNTLVTKQFECSDNMTDSLAAMRCLAVEGAEQFDDLMASFLAQWKSVPLVMDKWFAIQAIYQGDNVYDRLEALLAHNEFSMKNPNRARSLIGEFSMNNPRYFHCASGKGYQFLARQIAKLNEINPQVASRLITPLIQYKNFDEARQELMHKELLALNALDNLSKDLKEKLDATLS